MTLRIETVPLDWLRPRCAAHGKPRRWRASRGLTATIALSVAAAAASGVVGCATTTRTSVSQLWSAPMPPTVAPMRKILVLATRMDEANRRALEDSFVAALGEHGVEGVPSYKLFPDKLPEREQAEASIQGVGADGILTASFKGMREKLTYVPGRYSGGLWGGSYGWGYDGWGYGYGYYDSYVETDEILNLETTLWDAREVDTVVWAALTNTTNPRSGMDFVKSVTEKVIPALAASRLIPPKPKD